MRWVFVEQYSGCCDGPALFDNDDVGALVDVVGGDVIEVWVVGVVVCLSPSFLESAQYEFSDFVLVLWSEASQHLRSFSRSLTMSRWAAHSFVGSSPVSPVTLQLG